MHIGGRQIRASFFRPFDEADAIAQKVFVKARINKFFRLFEPIKIKVIQV